MPNLPSTLPADLRAAGLSVVDLADWQTRGRPTGGFAPVGVLWHHTGGDADGLAYAKWLALTGRSDLPAPLCQISIGRDGTVYVLAGGRANHAGVARASGTVASGDGNTLYVGVECQNNGSEGWSEPQYAAMVTTGVVLAKILGTSAQAQRAHRETSITGKWDPGLLDMDRFRADITNALEIAAKPPLPPVPTSRVKRARALLWEALRATKNPERGAKLRAALKKAPKL